MYIQEEGLGMRVSSALGSSRGEAERLRAEHEMKEGNFRVRAEQGTAGNSRMPFGDLDMKEKNNNERMHPKIPSEEISRVPSDRAKRLSESLSQLNDDFDAWTPEWGKHTPDSRQSLPACEIGSISKKLPAQGRSTQVEQEGEKPPQIEKAPSPAIIIEKGGKEGIATNRATSL